MSSNFDSYLTPSTSLGALAGQSDNNVTDDDDSDSKNSQSYKERRFVRYFVFKVGWTNVVDERLTLPRSRRGGTPSRKVTTLCRSWCLSASRQTSPATR